MEEYFDGFSEDITKWEIARAVADHDIDEFRNEFHKTDSSVQLLPRQYVILYGTIPKMEQKIYTKCKECKLVFNPRDILLHKTCSGKTHLPSTPQNLKKKVKTKGNSNKKSHSLFKKSPSPLIAVSSTVSESKSSPTKVSSKTPKVLTVSPISPTHTVTTTSTKSETRLSSSSPHTSKYNSVHSPKPPSKSISSTAHSPKSASKTATNIEVITSSSVSSSSSNSNSSRYKKSRKSNNNTKVTKEFDPDVHCGVVEGTRGPCTRSITCSNHRIQLRKLVPGRSKDIHQLIAERKAAKEKELKHGCSSGSYMPSNSSEEKDGFCQNTYVPNMATIVNTINSTPTTTYVPIMPKISPSSTNRSTATSILSNKQLNVTDAENKSTKTLDGGYITSIHNNSQDSAIGTVPVVYMPMSPISVVSPVQFVQIGKNMICLESPQSAMSSPLTTNQSVFLTIPSQLTNQQSNLKMYKSLPKPIAIPSYGMKNQRVECQRTDILMAINTKRDMLNNTQEYRAISLLNHTNTPHRPNILKVKSASKVNCKRPAADKLNSVSDSKQLRLAPNVNGFILHSDISETADAPQSNSIQEKIALLNMK